MKKVYDAVASTGKYTDRNTGVEKNRYLTVGAVFVNDEGKYSLKLESLPVGPAFNGWINFYEPRAKEEKPAQQKQAAEQFEDDKDLPF